MKKLLYIIPTEFFDNSDGVTKKAKQQLRAFEKNGYKVYVASYDGNKIVYCVYENGKFKVLYSKQCCIYLRRGELFRVVKKHIAKECFDVSYIRYPYSSFKFIEMIKGLKKYNTKVLIEVPTYPIPRDLPRKLRYIPHRMVFIGEKLTVGKMKYYVDEIYSMGEPVESIFGIKNTNIPNGIEVASFLPRIVNDNKNELHILYCGSLFSYQGVDRIINGIANYYGDASPKNIDVYLEVVGDGPCLSELKQLVIEKKLLDRINFYGFKSGDDLNKIVDKCNLACSLLASHRSKLITNTSPLKTKEYMARGIPFVYAYNDSSMPENLNFALKIVSSEEPIDIYQLIEFYKTYVDNQGKIIEEMRSYAIENFAWEKILENV